MATKINVFNTTKEDIVRIIKENFTAKHSWWNNVPNSAIHWLNREQEGANFRFKYFRVTSAYDTSTVITTESLAIKLVCPPDSRTFFMKIPCTVNVRGFSEPFEYETLVLCSAKVYGAEPYMPSWFSGNTYISNIIDHRGNYTYIENGNTIRQSLGFYDIYDSGTRVDDWCYWRMGGKPDQFGGVVHRNWTDSQKASISSYIKQILEKVTYGTARHFNIMDDYPGWETQRSTFYNGYGLGRYENEYFMTYDELPAPLFDYTQVNDIANYINTGDARGAINPFDNTPEKTEIDDLTNTSYRIFVSPDTNDKKKTHFSIIAYNPEYIEYGENVAGEYGMHVSLEYMKTQTSTTESFNLGNFAQPKYPTLGYIMSDVGYSSLFNLSFRNLNDNTQPIRVYSVGFEADTTKESHCQLVGANYGGQALSKKHIVDGYRFEHGNNWIEVLFRAVDISDLNGGYPDPDDTDNDKSGTDSDYSGASGLRTFVINNTDFDTINSKLWSTDWSTVFKSNSIDPIRCVIACKGIPFTADNVSSAEVMIANLDTGLSKNYVKTVKSFTTNSVLMPSFSGDFTDITLTHIRCYLPYIGWVELPASECISRVAYKSVGIEARPKRLKFKYIVDFVDGNVRCIVSVNDTERWFFDGNCAIDIPVTSDNHTQAISNAIRSGVQTGLSIVTAIGGAVAKNAGAVAGGVMGAMQSAPNIFPTYSFTATSNGSGYINASMNQHIMLVIEHPNVIRSAGYAKRVGVPCGLSLNLGSLHGYTRCVDVNVTGIDATPNEIQRIKSLLESGVYL